MRADRKGATDQEEAILPLNVMLYLWTGHDLGRPRLKQAASSAIT
jgi:hypothetical protein